MAAAATTAGRTGLPVWVALAASAGSRLRTPAKAGRDRAHARRQHAVGAAHHGVLLVDDGRDAAQRRGEQRRNGRIAAEADHHRGLEPRQHEPGLEHAVAQHACRSCASENGLRPRMVALGMTCTALAAETRRHGARRANRSTSSTATSRLRQRRGQRLGRKQMAAGAAGGDQHRDRLAAWRASWMASADAAQSAPRRMNDFRPGCPRRQSRWPASRRAAARASAPAACPCRRRARSSTSRRRR